MGLHHHHGSGGILIHDHLRADPDHEHVVVQYDSNSLYYDDYYNPTDYGPANHNHDNDSGFNHVNNYAHHYDPHDWDTEDRAGK